MTTLHETAYPSLKPDPTARELAELYTPTEGERVLVAGIGKRPFASSKPLAMDAPRLRRSLNTVWYVQTGLGRIRS